MRQIFPGKVTAVIFQRLLGQAFSHNGIRSIPPVVVGVSVNSESPHG